MCAVSPMVTPPIPGVVARGMVGSVTSPLTDRLYGAQPPEIAEHHTPLSVTVLVPSLLWLISSVRSPNTYQAGLV